MRRVYSIVTLPILAVISCLLYGGCASPQTVSRAQFGVVSKMTSEEAFREFGLPASPERREQIRQLLVEEIEREKRGEAGEEMLRTLCVLLFSLGIPED